MRSRQRRIYGQGTIEELPSGALRARIWINGVRKQSTFDDPDAATLWLARQVVEKHQGVTGTRPDATLSQLRDEYLKDLKAHGRRASTLDRYDSHLDAVLARYGSVRLRDVTGPVLERMVREMTAAGWAAATVRNRLNVITGIVRYAQRVGYVEARPLPVRRPGTAIDTAPDPYSPEEVAALIAAAKHAGPRQHAAIALMAYAGLRRSEVFRLQARDYDPAKRLLTLPVRSHEDRPKSGKGRSVPVGGALHAALAALPARGAELAVSDPDWKTEAGLDGWLAPIWKAAGLEGVRLHRLRHYAATQLARNGARVDQLMTWFGWSSLATAKRYIHDADPEDRAAVDRFDPIGPQQATGGGGDGG